MPIKSQSNSKNKGNTTSRQEFVNTEQVLFELASAERLSILSRLSERKLLATYPHYQKT
jgi:hypothetical protein